MITHDSIETTPSVEPQPDGEKSPWWPESYEFLEQVEARVEELTRALYSASQFPVVETTSIKGQD